MEIMTDQRLKRTLKYIRALFFFSLFGSLLIALALLAVFAYAKVLGPPPLAVPQSSLYYAEDGTIFAESHSGQKRYWVNLEDISPSLVDAAVSIEDQHFYDHNGFDFKRIAGAAVADVKAMAKVQGASTITQQYARNLFLEHDKTWARKLHEAFYTIRLEMNYSKSVILEGYLNTIYYGNGAYGVQAASQYYFGKDASKLSLAEASLLAGIPKGPSIYSPLASLEKAKERQSVILQAMVDNNMITKKQAKTAAAKELKIVGEHPHNKLGTAPYFQDAVTNALKNELHLDDRTIALGGLKVYTTLDLKQQDVAEKTIANTISDDSDIQIGFVSMDPKIGYVKALVGGRDYTESSFNRTIQAIRQPGSTIKPLLYYAALEEGFTPATKMRSELTTFRFENRDDYTPHNFNNQYADAEITMAQALALSDNVYAVKTNLFLSDHALPNIIKRFGITTTMENVPSLALGTSGVRVIEMANAYSIFANGGKKVSPVLIKRIENHKGEVIYESPSETKAVLKPELAFVMTHMMTGMFDKKLNGYASVTGSTISNLMTRTYAGKSGSTDTDSWMIGFSPQLVSAVWTGYDDGRAVEVTAEKTYAKKVWVTYMEKALENKPEKSFKAPKGTIGVYINPESGLLATKDCPIKRFTYFVEGTEPTEYCLEHLSKKELKQYKKKQNGSVPEDPWYKKIMPWS